MKVFKFHLSVVHKRFFSNALLGSLAIALPAIAVPTPARAADVISSIQQAPYSRVFYTGSVYAVKDQDYKSGDPKLGFFSVWSNNPTKNDLKVNVRYCLKDQALSELGNKLTQITLLSNNQSLLAINQVVQEKPVHEKTISSGYYEPSDFFTGLDGFDDLFFGNLPYDGDPVDFSSVYVPPATCNAGFTQFEISSLRSSIAQLPNQTLQVQLSFSNGETQTWQLGQGTVQALKQLVAIR